MSWTQTGGAGRPAVLGFFPRLTQFNALCYRIEEVKEQSLELGVVSSPGLSAFLEVEARSVVQDHLHLHSESEPGLHETLCFLVLFLFLFFFLRFIYYYM